MIRSDLVLRLAAMNPHFYKKDCQAVVDAILACIADALVADDRVEIGGFGSFSVKERRAREGRNPKTGANVSVLAKAVLVFKAGRDMRDWVNPERGRPVPRSNHGATGASSNSPANRSKARLAGKVPRPGYQQVNDLDLPPPIHELEHSSRHLR